MVIWIASVSERFRKVDAPPAPSPISGHQNLAKTSIISRSNLFFFLGITQSITICI